MAGQCGMDRVLLEEYAEGILNQAEQLLLEHHTRNCASCRKYLTEMKLLFWEIGNLAKQQIDYPEELNALGARIIAAMPLKPRTARETIKTLMSSQKKLWTGILKAAVPASGKHEKPEKKKPSVVQALSRRLSSRIGRAGKNILRRQIGHILGGAR